MYATIAYVMVVGKCKRLNLRLSFEKLQFQLMGRSKLQLLSDRDRSKTNVTRYILPLSKVIKCRKTT